MWATRRLRAVSSRLPAKVMREEAEIRRTAGEDRIRQRIFIGTRRYLDPIAGLSERPLAGGPSYVRRVE